MYVVKLIRSSEWKSLSIPREASSIYNATKFSQKK
ncbi:hypothetical protein [Kordia sp.]